MPTSSVKISSPDRGSDPIVAALQNYDEPLVREVAFQLVKPRGQWPVETLIERCVEALGNAAVIDRRLEQLDSLERRLLALVARSRLRNWSIGQLVALATTLGNQGGTKVVVELLQQGLAFPQLSSTSCLRRWDDLFSGGSPSLVELFFPPLVLERGPESNLGLPQLEEPEPAPKAVHQADGLIWPLRMAALWQQTQAAPLRRTQMGGFFKRDFERLRNDPLLNQDADSGRHSVGVVSATLAQTIGILVAQEGELVSGKLPRSWREGLPAAIASLWRSFLESGSKETGVSGAADEILPASASLLSLVLLECLPEQAWARVSKVEEWVMEHHPHWGHRRRLPDGDFGPIGRFLLGPAFEMALVQCSDPMAACSLVRISPLGRWLVGRNAPSPETSAGGKALLIQPNLEAIVYRQGLDPGLVAAISEFAEWKTFGSACTVQFTPESVYRGLEAGWDFDRIMALLEQASSRPIPVSFIESLRTWARKRERLTVYPCAALFEFPDALDLDDALARGFPGVRLSDRLAAVANEAQIDYRHFRLTATRDYVLPPGQCVSVEADGVTLCVDSARSDLLLETELTRFAMPLTANEDKDRILYRVTPESLAASGLLTSHLEEWFLRRTGGSTPPAVRLLLERGSETNELTLRTQTVLYVGAPEMAEGLLQWPGTAMLFEGRLGPTALAVAANSVEQLIEQLRALGIAINRNR